MLKSKLLLLLTHSIVALWIWKESESWTKKQTVRVFLGPGLRLQGWETDRICGRSESESESESESYFWFWFTYPNRWFWFWSAALPVLSPPSHISDTNSLPSEIRLLDSYMSASRVMISISNLKPDLCKFRSQTENSKVSRCVLVQEGEKNMD